MPLPPHREPDGPPVEVFEQTTRLQDGDDAEMTAAMRHQGPRRSSRPSASSTT